MDIDQNFQAYLASITNAQNGNGSTAQTYDLTPWQNGNNHHQEHTNDNQQSRWGGDQENSRSKQDREPYKKPYDPNYSPLDANGEYKGKKKPCRFWQLGKCAKGAKCTFLHDAE